MSSDLPRQGLLDTNILILRRWIDTGELLDEMAISAITLAELSAGPHLRPGNGGGHRRRPQAVQEDR